jgi:hypothetical protein
MDLVRFEAAATELLDSLGDRLSDATRDFVRSMLFGGEEWLAADELAGVLVTDRTPIDERERDLLRELLYSLDIDDHDEDARDYPALYDRERALAALNIVDAAPGPTSHPDG